jgi:hypothetical protein
VSKIRAFIPALLMLSSCAAPPRSVPTTEQTRLERPSLLTRDVPAIASQAPCDAVPTPEPEAIAPCVEKLCREGSRHTVIAAPKERYLALVGCYAIHSQERFATKTPPQHLELTSVLSGEGRSPILEAKGSGYPIQVWWIAEDDHVVVQWSQGFQGRRFCGRMDEDGSLFGVSFIADDTGYDSASIFPVTYLRTTCKSKID